MIMYVNMLKAYRAIFLISQSYYENYIKKSKHFEDPYI